MYRLRACRCRAGRDQDGVDRVAAGSSTSTSRRAGGRRRRRIAPLEHQPFGLTLAAVAASAASSSQVRRLDERREQQRGRVRLAMSVSSQRAPLAAAASSRTSSPSCFDQVVGHDARPAPRARIDCAERLAADPLLELANGRTWPSARARSRRRSRSRRAGARRGQATSG